MNHTFVLQSDYIELNKLLKFYGLVDSGADAKQVIAQWLVTVNGTIETRIRNKLKDSDRVVFGDTTIVVQQT